MNHMQRLIPGLLLFAATLFSCQADPGRRQTVSTDGIEGGKLIFEDAFERATLGSDWTVNPAAKIVGGWLQIQGNKNEPPVWLLSTTLPEKVRVEFDARSLSDQGDIKFEAFGDGEKHASGYIMVYGAHSNKEDWFARLDEHGKDRLVRRSSKVIKDKIYHMALVRTDNRVRWFIDGRPFFSYDDKNPLQGPKHAYFAFNDWDVPLQFDNLKVYDLGQ